MSDYHKEQSLSNDHARKHIIKVP